MSAASARSSSRQVLSLVGLALVLGGVVWYQFFRTTGTDVATSNSGTAQSAKNAAGPMPTPQVVRLSELQAVSELTDPGRNPFAYGARPAPPPAVRPVAAPSMATLAPPSLPPVPQGPPPIALKLAGITLAQETGRPMATLKDPVSNTLFQAFEGDIVDGRYRVVKVGTQSVVLSYVDGSGTRTVSLGS